MGLFLLGLLIGGLLGFAIGMALGRRHPRAQGGFAMREAPAPGPAPPTPEA